MSSNKQVIENVRQKFLREYEENRDLYHENDIKNIKQNDWSIERFVLVNINEKQALKAVIKAMQWRNSFGVHNFNDQYFPYEIYKIGEVFHFGCDKDCRPVVWMVNKNHFKSKELGTLVRQFYVYQFDKVDRQVSHQGWVIVADSIGSGLSNGDVDYSRFIVETLQSYYPRAMKYMIVIELPWILETTLKLVMVFMSEEFKNIFKTIKKQELIEYLDSDVIPVHMNGNNDKLKIEIPNGVQKLEQMPNFGFTRKQIDKIYATFKCINEF